MHHSVCDLYIVAFELFQQFWIISCLLYLFFSISFFFLNWITLHTHFSFLFQINFAPVTRTKLFAIFLKNIIKWILSLLFWNKSGNKNMKRGAWRRIQPSTFDWAAHRVEKKRKWLETNLLSIWKRPRCDWFPNELCPWSCWSLEVCHCDKNYGWEQRINVGNVFENCFLGLDFIHIS